MASNIGKRVIENLNKQITEESIISYIYMAMAGVLTDMGLTNCSKWMREQSHERTARAEKIMDHILTRGAKFKLLPIPAPKADWRAPLHIFEEYARLEQRTTASITTLCDLAMGERDHGTSNFITWFVDEQIRKDAQAAFLIDRLRKMQTSDLGVLMFDAELGTMIKKKG